MTACRSPPGTVKYGYKYIQIPLYSHQVRLKFPEILIDPHILMFDGQIPMFGGWIPILDDYKTPILFWGVPWVVDPSPYHHIEFRSKE